MEKKLSRRDIIKMCAMALGVPVGWDLTGIAVVYGAPRIEENEFDASEDKTAMEVKVTAKGHTTVLKLNSSQAAKDFHTQLPLSITVEDYGNIEKIFYPPEKLNTNDTPLAEQCHAGTLAYYSPWGNVVLFYGSFGSAAGLYELGHSVSGTEYINSD